MTTSEQTEKRQKNNCIDISSDKLGRLQTRKPRQKWLRNVTCTREIESILIAAQNNAIRTNYIKAKTGN